MYCSFLSFLVRSLFFWHPSPAPAGDCDGLFFFCAGFSQHPTAGWHFQLWRRSSGLAFPQPPPCDGRAAGLAEVEARASPGPRHDPSASSRLQQVLLANPSGSPSHSSCTCAAEAETLWIGPRTAAAGAVRAEHRCALAGWLIGR